MNPDDDSDDDTLNGRQSIKKYWNEQFKKEDMNENAIKPEFDIFSKFLA